MSFYHYHKHLFRAFDDGSKSNAICKIKEIEQLTKDTNSDYRITPEYKLNLENERSYNSIIHRLSDVISSKINEEIVLLEKIYDNISNKNNHDDKSDIENNYKSIDDLRKQNLAYNVYNISLWLISLKVLHRFRKGPVEYSTKIYYDIGDGLELPITIHDTDNWEEKKDEISHILARIWYYEKYGRDIHETTNTNEPNENNTWLHYI